MWMTRAHCTQVSFSWRIRRWIRPRLREKDELIELITVIRPFRRVFTQVIFGFDTEKVTPSWENKSSCGAVWNGFIRATLPPEYAISALIILLIGSADAQ